MIEQLGLLHPGHLLGGERDTNRPRILSAEEESLMITDQHRTFVYVGLAGEGEYIGAGGLYRYATDNAEWQNLSKGLPSNPQVRALLMHPYNPAILYAGTNRGPYRSDDRGEHWGALEAPQQGTDVWSLAFHPNDANIIYAGYEPCAIYRSEDGGEHWKKMNTEKVVFPHITTYMPPLGKRVIGMAADPSDPQDMYAAIEVGGLLASHDGGESWESITDGLYVRNNTVDLHGVQVSRAAPGTVYIITQVGMFRSRYRGRQWEHVQIDEMFPGGSYCRGLLVSPDNPHTMYLAAGAGGGGAPKGTQEAGALFRSRNIGETWERVDIGDTPPSRMSQIAIDRADPSHVYCCAMHGQVYGSRDGGQTWQKSQLPAETMRSRRIYAMACG
jgi:photosystem II stability/assembly factor-like uncharacterized protein